MPEWKQQPSRKSPSFADSDLEQRQRETGVLSGAALEARAVAGSPSGPTSTIVGGLPLPSPGPPVGRPDVGHLDVLQPLGEDQLLVDGHPQQLVQSLLLVLSSGQLALERVRLLQANTERVLVLT